MNIILIGFASCGKTATAQALCGKTGLRHIDLDRVIEERYERKHGKRATCRQIFKKEGGDIFSLLENDALRSLSNMRQTILSTGGRTPIYEENRPLIKSLGTVVYLNCGVGTILKRMLRKGFPLSMKSNAEGVAEEWDRREPVYARLADITVVNDALSPDETAKVIVERLEGLGGLKSKE
jgi:shikimate kinase